jgi:hypothetical protein
MLLNNIDLIYIAYVLTRHIKALAQNYIKRKKNVLKLFVIPPDSLTTKSANLSGSLSTLYLSRIIWITSRV